ncbi:DNA primase [Echinimonas agarilytica]|uniref:DNA primase n=1 Tax=Echinimonas agarilytica TaxID=1215918 RepID=A0AA42B7N4_9GAMM|nr:DNA primase [Echinimonas agarilytica]MCM2680365.1 DNA primase [Echinimonas agarilytica]
MAILRSFIDDLLARTDIVDLIEARVPLKKAGKNYSACCPFHNEKTPSFSVAPDKQFYHCFGCGAHGNAIGFLMEFDRLEFPEAIEELAKVHGLEVQYEENSSGQQRPSRPQANDQYQLMEQVSRFFRQNLQQHSDGKKAIEYLKKRGLSGNIAKQFGIGFAGAEWDSVLQTFGQTPQLKNYLVELGMLIQKDNGKQYDRFRDRIMFPIRDRRGRVIGFGGRVLDQGEPKYLNSPETPIFHKGQELYGLYEVKQAHRSIEHVVIVEGYMDVVALAQHGVDYAVASLGTATTPEQLQMLFRQTRHVTCCYDGDKAGRGAAWRALENALPLLKDGLTLDFVFLPDGEDPDTLIQAQGKAAFEQLLSDATPLSKVLFDQLLTQHNAATDTGKSALVAAAKPLLERLPPGVYFDMMQQQLAHLVGMQEEQLSRHIKVSSSPSSQNAQGQMKMTPMRKAIALLLQMPQLATKVPPQPELAELDIAGIQIFMGLLDHCRDHNVVHTGQLLEKYREHPAYASLSRLAAWDSGIESEPECELEFMDIYSHFIDRYLEQRLELLLLKEKQGELSRDERHEYMALLQALKPKQANVD